VGITDIYAPKLFTNKLRSAVMYF